MPSVKNAGPWTLLVPFKNWNDDPKEKQNYDEIERWSLRIPRGLIQNDQQTHTQTNTVVSGSFTSYMESTNPVNFELGRQYKVSGMWPGLSSVTSGDIMQIGLALSAQQGSFHPGIPTTALINSQFHKITVSGGWQEGGSMFIYILPTRGYNGLFKPGIWATMSTGTGPGSILAGASGSGNVGSLITEDLGAVQ